jgi:hypothetical protein
MDCPKCKSPNPDDAQFCSLCYENLKVKPSSGPVMAFNDTSTNIGKWTASGPLMVREDGFYFFLKQFVDRDRAVMRAAGASGGLVGAVVAAGIDSMNGESEPPGQAVRQKTSGISDMFQKALDDAPDIVSCEQYFLIPKKDMTQLSFDFLGMLNVKTTGETLKIQGAGPKDKLSGFLVMRGYPVER